MIKRTRMTEVIEYKKKRREKREEKSSCPNAFWNDDIRASLE